MEVKHQQGSPDVGRQDGGPDNGQGGFLNHPPALVGPDQANDEEGDQGGDEEERAQQVNLNDDGHQRHQRQPVDGPVAILEHCQPAHQHVRRQHCTPGIHVLGELPAGQPTDVHEDQADQEGEAAGTMGLDGQEVHPNAPTDVDDQVSDNFVTKPGAEQANQGPVEIGK